jgi:hypothetical protein
MPTFEEKIRDDKISQPIHRSFKLQIWEREFNSIQDVTKRDEIIFNAGKWIFNRLERIRKEVSAISFTLSKEKLLRVHVGYINRTYHTVRQMIDNVPDNPSGAIIGEQLAQIKIPGNWMGEDLAPDTILTTCIDGACFPLTAALLHQEETKGSQGIDHLNVLENEKKIMLLGQYYSYLEDAWKEILWNDYIFEENEELISIRPSGNIYDQARAISNYRKDSLVNQSVMQVIHIWRTKLSFVKKQQLSRRPTITICGSGKKRKFKIQYANETNSADAPPLSVIARLIWQEEYFENILNSDLPNLPGISLSMLLDSWEVLGALSDALLKNFPEDNSVYALGTIYKYAPGISTSELVNLLMSTLSINKINAFSILKFFTFDPGAKDDLWSTPLIKFEDKLYPLFSPLLHGNLIRNLELWMKKGDMDLSQRGYLFEAEACKEIKNAIKKSNFLKNSSSNEKSIKIGPKKEEIDIVLNIGNAILIGEAKCTLYPTEAMDYFQFFQIMTYASEQAKRKANIATENLNELIDKIGGFDDKKMEIFRIMPFILTNLTLGVGFSIGDVPILDLLTLTKYLKEATWEKMVRFEPDGTKTVGETVRFYSSEDEAEAHIEDYLKKIPQIEFYKPFFKIENFPHIKFDKGEKKAVSTDLTVELPVPNLFTDD